MSLENPEDKPHWSEVFWTEIYSGLENLEPKNVDLKPNEREILKRSLRWNVHEAMEELERKEESVEHYERFITKGWKTLDEQFGGGTLGEFINEEKQRIEELKDEIKVDIDLEAKL